MIEDVFILTDLKDIDALACNIIALSHKNKRFAFYGEMGSGKTTLIKSLCKILGADEQTASPTYSIINDYSGKETIYHLDLFRINSVHELVDLGLEDYVVSDNYIFIEWPEIIETIVHHYAFIQIYISIIDAHTREIKIIH